METYEDIYDTICRVCLLRGDSENMVFLTDNISEDGLSSYGKSVITFAQITIEKDQFLPISMCVKCLLLLKQAILFKLTCEASEKHLRNTLQRHSNVKDFKEKIVEFIMYRSLFPTEISEIRLKRSTRLKKHKKPGREEKNKKQQENLILEFDSDHFDIATPSEEKVSKNVKLKKSQILDKLESLVESNASYNNALKAKLRYQRSMKKDEKIICPICQKAMANKKTFDWHMQRHNGFRYICEHCGRGFPIKQQLQVHQVCKHGTGTYIQCQQCSFKAPRKYDLIEHERLHTGERPFTCDKCGLTFRSRGIWKKHQVHHSEKTVQCNQCPRKFYRRSEMLAHCNNVHERVYVYSCSKCCATYAKTSSVRRHMTEKHGIPREMQGKVLRINKGSATSEQLERINKGRIVNDYVESVTKKSAIDEYIDKNRARIVNKHVEKDPIFSDTSLK